MSDFQGLIEAGMNNAIESAVKKVVRETWGYGIDTEIKAVLKEQAKKAIENSPELQQMIFDALKSWISTQTADDIRKQREDNIRKFGSR